jgi:hypothetical protein
VQLTSEIIPNIYNICDCVNNLISLPNDVILSNNIKINDIIDIIDANNNRKEYIITDIQDNKIEINKNLIGNKCFIYGTKVNDFHIIDKTYIFTMNVCATQELYKLIQQQNEIIRDLQNRITILENK